MIIELRHGDKKAVADTNGGYLINYADENGDIIYPKRVFTTESGEQKNRGGCHVCLPNFGPGGDSGLDQHGYGRSSEWNIAESSDNQVVFSLDGQGSYADMPATLRYVLGDAGLAMELKLTNNSASQLPTGPAFHPYFITGDHLVVDGEAFDMTAYNDMLLSDEMDEKILNTNRRTIMLKSTNLPVWAQWSDRLGEYFCVEPTYGGYTFDAQNHRRTDTLQVGESKIYKLEVN